MSAPCLPFLHKQAAPPYLSFTVLQFAVLCTLISTNIAQNTTINAPTNNTTDHDALVAIKASIQQDPQGILNSWNNSLHFCQWQGVTCSTRHQRVTVVDLSSGGLTGSLSPSVGNLSFLRQLWIQNNSFDGQIPHEIGNLFRLQELRLNNNSFEGNIPSNLSRCSDLRVLHLGFNRLVGRIPNELGLLSMLNLLIIHRNNIEGGIPRFIGNLTLLETLSLAECRLGGSIPDVFHRLTNLKRIALPGNNLVGIIPPSLFNLSSLEELFFENNQLEGTLPTNLGSLQQNLQVLSISDNRFTGPLPLSIFNSTTLGVIDVARNNFSGEIVINSLAVCNLVIFSLGSNSFRSDEGTELNFIDPLSRCPMLEVIDISDNQFRGFVPNSIGNLSNRTLYFISVASNALSGSIPSSITNLSGLTSLDLSKNGFTGEIPVNIGNLRNLRILNLEENNFSGNIPSSVGNLTLLIEIHLGLNRLNGTIPSSLGNCGRLIGLRLDQNELSGSIPREIFQLSSLSISLNLARNRLSGQLPSEVGDLTNLNELIVANNQLSGEIPSGFARFTSLQKLDLSNNSFQGPLPTSLRSLRALENLNISYNNFTGEIPSFLNTMPLVNLNISFNDFEGEVTQSGVFANASAISIVGNNRLCGGIPQLRLPRCRRERKNKLSLAVILVISIASVLVCASMVLFFVCCWRKRDKEDGPISNSKSEESMVKVSYEMLFKATEGFVAKNLIGVGSFSSVYRGFLDIENGVVVVAVKVLNLHHKGGSKSFVSECEALRNTRHRNLVKVVTCCSGIDFQGNEFKAIIYEFMPNGSLDRWLSSSHRTKSDENEVVGLSLVQRVCIALDVANALDYLHNNSGKTIVHCDLKPNNILLDEDMVAHVSDFGISKILQSENVNRYQSSSVGVRGTIGYAAPEYGVGSKVSTSADIYSYGILLLEMMTNKKPTDPMFQDGLNLHNYCNKALLDRSLDIVDPILLLNENGDQKAAQTTNKEGETLKYMDTERCLRLMLEIGVSCSMESPQYRMGVTNVIHELHLIKDAILGNSNDF